MLFINYSKYLTHNFGNVKHYFLIENNNIHRIHLAVDQCEGHLNLLYKLIP